MGEKWKQWKILYSRSAKSLHGDCSHEIKGCLLLGRKAITNLDSLLESRDITLLTKIHVVKTTIIPVMYGCESLTKKSEHWKTDALVLEKTRESLGSMEINTANSKGNQP